MDLFEHQGKELLAGHGLAVPRGAVASDPGEAVAAAAGLGYPVVVKAQVRTGGRGRAGGIRRAGDPEEVRSHAAAILGLDIRGERVGHLLVEEGLEVARELYVSLVLDRPGRGYLLLASAAGGMAIEDAAAADPATVARVALDPRAAITDEAVTAALAGLDLDPPTRSSVASAAAAAGRAFVAADAELVEVNPLAVLADGRVVALDAKVTLDDSARFRHPEWASWTAAAAHDARERQAGDRGLSYVGLDGTVGVIGNGAGLVLATLDVVARAGGRAANFLDIGGGAGAEVVSAALEVVDADPAVRAILVNIFGGITRGEEVAGGIIDAANRLELRSPVVVRLDGTNAAEGRAILARHLSGRLRTEASMDDAARVAVALADSAGR